MDFSQKHPIKIYKIDSYWLPW